MVYVSTEWHPNTVPAADSMPIPSTLCRVAGGHDEIEMRGKVTGHLRQISTVVIVLGVAAMSHRASTYATPSNAGRVTRGVVQILHAPVPNMPGTTQDVYVYRPPVPDSKLLPVLYFLHGASGRPSDIFRKGGLGRLLDAFFARGNPPFVLVAPDGNGANHSDTE